jgi:hypothetical protein
MQKRLFLILLVSCTSACYDFKIDRDGGVAGEGSVESQTSAAVGSEVDPGATGSAVTMSVAGNGAAGTSVTGASGTSGAPAVGNPSGECNQTSCADGCCDGNSCLKFAAQSSSQCGAGAAACKPCPEGLTCGATGACGCDPTSCPTGCCAEGKCVALGDQSNAQCGVQGAACATCGEGQSCSADGTCVCTPATCSDGCCSDNKCIAKTNQSNSVCGSNGNACGECGSGDSCVDGSCSCGGGSCPGCCSNGACVVSLKMTCGVGGGQCKTCDSTQSCSAQGECICDASSCPNGCCDENGRCQVPSAEACGTSGKACTKCTLQNASASCTSGKCSVSECKDTWGNCDNSDTNGCETNLTTKSHCGTCDACPTRENTSSILCTNGECIYKCINGYYDAVNSCAPVDCGKPASPSNGSVKTSNGTTYGKQASYSCSSGYSLVGNNTATCQAGGTWSGSTPSCTRDPYCGDGEVNNGEQCDPNNSSATKWTCGQSSASDACKRRYIYTSCNGSSDCPNGFCNTSSSICYPIDTSCTDLGQTCSVNGGMVGYCALGQMCLLKCSRSGTGESVNCPPNIPCVQISISSTNTTKIWVCKKDG